jgi:DNA-binding Lrp family transcriptional regulator
MLAAEVGLSPSACLRRIQRLEQEGVLLGYTAVIGRPDDAPLISVIVNITLERQTGAYLERFESEVRRHPEIQECYLMTGGADYFIRVEVESHSDFERLHRDVLSTLPGVLRIHSSFSIRNALAGRRSEKTKRRV